MTEVEVPALMLAVDDLAKLLKVSTRHVYRMADGGLMPRPLKLGHLNRWLKTEIEDWLKAGAKPIRVAARRAVSVA